MIKYLLLLTLFFTTLFAEQTILIDNNSTIEKFKISTYEDKTSSLTIKDITSIKEFKEVGNNVSNGFTNSTFWYKLTIKNRSSQTIQRYLKLTESIMDKIDFYIYSNNKMIKHKKDGVGYFKEGQKNYLERPVIEFDLKKDETKIIYIKISSLYPMFNSFQIYDKNELDKFEREYTTIYAFLIGSLLSLALYNLMIFFYTKDISYIFYVLYSLSFISWQTSMSGIYPFDTFLNTESYYFIGASIPLLVAFLTFFTNHILDIKTMSKKYYHTLNFIGGFYIILAICSIFAFEPSILIMNATASFVLPFLLYMGYISYKNGNKIAIFYLLAQVGFLSMSTLFSLSSFGFLEYNFYSRHGIMVGSFIEMILFSLALAYRIKILEKEKFIIMQKAKDTLEINVKKRTKELEESKKKLEILANKDFLSGLLNRRPLFEMSNRLISLAKRDNTIISVLLFDIDKFKDINDTYGHKEGDEVIKAFAKTLKKDRRVSDLVARISGEEFVILLPSTNHKDASIIAEEIRQEVETLQVQIENFNISFTVSCGVSSLKKEDKNLDDLIARADKRLYMAKNNGRNIVVDNDIV